RNGGRAQQQQQQRSAPSVAPTSSAATTQGESTVKTIADAVVNQQSQMAIRDQSRCRNLGTRTPKNWDVSPTLRNAGHAQKWTDEDLLAMLPLSLEEGSGAEYCPEKPSTWKFGVQKKPQSSRVEILPNAIIDPVSLHGEQRQTEETIAEIILTQITKKRRGAPVNTNGGERFRGYDDRSRLPAGELQAENWLGE
ncbi:hypothetical protein BV898_19756, partial [Hypsibius exemplaris]